MGSRIAAIAWITWRELAHRGTWMVVAVLWAVGFVGPVLLQSVLSRGPSAGALLSITQGFLWVGSWVTIFSAAAAVEWDRDRRTMAVVLVRPLERWEYLAGRLLGVLSLYFLFAVVGVASVSAAALLSPQADLPRTFVLGVLERGVNDVCWIALAFALGSVVRPASALVLVVLGALASSVMPRLPPIHPLITTIAFLTHYLTPAAAPIDFFKGTAALEGTRAWSMVAGALVENLLYGLAAWAAAVVAFERRDVRLRDTP